WSRLGAGHAKQLAQPGASFHKRAAHEPQGRESHGQPQPVLDSVRLNSPAHRRPQIVLLPREEADRGRVWWLRYVRAHLREEPLPRAAADRRALAGRGDLRPGVLANSLEHAEARFRAAGRAHALDQAVVD